MTTNDVLSIFDLPTITEYNEIYNLIVTAKNSSPNYPWL